MSEEIKLKKFKNSLLIELKDDKQPIILKGLDNIKKFFEEEIEFWNSCSNKAGHLDNFVHYFQESNNQLNGYINNFKIWDENQRTQQWNHLKGEIEQQRSRQGLFVFLSISVSGQFLYEMYNTNHQTGDAAYIFLIGQNFSNINDYNYLNGLLKAYEFKNQTETLFIRKRDSERKALNNLRNAFFSKYQDVSNQYSIFKNELDGWKSDFIDKNTEYNKSLKDDYEKFISEKQERFEGLEKEYTELLRFQGPVKFWTTRVSKYKTQGQWWLGGLITVVSVLLAGLVLMLYNEPEIFGYKLFAGDPKAVKGVIIFASILSFGAYLAKTFTKLTLSSFHLQRDAEEREQLTIVYLALIKDSNLETEDRSLVLQALFHRTDTGLLSTKDNFSATFGQFLSQYLKK